MSDFSDFQLKEYENISQAHFKTNEMIAAFFRYYLLLMAIPMSTLGAAIISVDQAQQFAILSTWQFPIVIFLLVFAIIGFFIMC